MKKVLYQSRKTVVFFMRMLLFVVLALIFFAAMSFNNPWMLRISRTSAVTLLTFMASFYFLSRIYGSYDVGTRKSRPIIFSLAMVTFFTDIISFAMLVVMNINETTSNRMYGYLGWDLLILLAAYIIQYFACVAAAYGGNAFYFSFTPPERCILISDSRNARKIRKGIEKFKKQYDLVEIVSYDDPELLDKIYDCDTVFADETTPANMNLVTEYCYANRKNIHAAMNLTRLIFMTGMPQPVEDMSFITSRAQEKTMGQRLIKRAGDILISVSGLLLLSPIMLVTALLIKLEDGGEVIFRQNRVTINQKIFTMYKFRSMSQNADKTMVTNGDARITKVGAVIRKFRIDELPQLINVLKGEMSFVGPRSEMADRVYVSTMDIPEYAYRYRMKGGITGYAQIYGKYNTSAHDKLMLDLTYIQTFSIWSDIKIIFRTIAVLFSPEESTEAYEAEDEEKFEEMTQKACESSKEIR